MSGEVGRMAPCKITEQLASALERRVPTGGTLCASPGVYASHEGFQFGVKPTGTLVASNPKTRRANDRQNQRSRSFPASGIWHIGRVHELSVGAVY